LSEAKKKLLIKEESKKGKTISTTPLLCRELATWKSWVDVVDIKWV
jgi:hypothetical protein